MSNDTNKFPEVKGIIHSKPVKKVIGKKGDNKGKELDIPSIVLEVKYNGSDRSNLTCFNIARGVALGDFEIGDTVLITYVPESIPWKDDYITKTKAIYIKHADVEYNDTKDLRPQRPVKEKETVFVAPNPNAEPEEESDLPFMFTIPITIATLLSFFTL